MNNNFLPIFIILYNPDQNCINRINLFKIKYSLYVYDNSRLKTSLSTEKITYHAASENNGIAGAFMWMYKHCSEMGYESFLFFDQDTIFTDNTLDFINTHYNKLNSTQLISHYSSESKKRGNVRFVINSGTVFPTNLLLEGKSILERFFVDGVDLSLCQLARQLKFKILSNYAPNIDHFSDQGYYRTKILFFNMNLKLYPKHRRQEFYKSHFRLLIDSIIKYKSIVDTLIISKYTISYAISQFSAILFYKKQ